MAQGFTYYGANKLLDKYFSAADFTPPSNLFIGICTGGVTEAGVATGEPSGSGYGRVQLTNNATNFPAANNGAKSNGVAIQFPEASGSWGTIAYVFVADQSSGGNIIAYGAISPTKAIDSGDTFILPIGDLDITLD